MFLLREFSTHCTSWIEHRGFNFGSKKQNKVIISHIYGAFQEGTEQSRKLCIFISGSSNKTSRHLRLLTYLREL